MSERLYNWVTDKFTGVDIIDLNFVVSNLDDIFITEDELCETACFDSLAMYSAESIKVNQIGNIPIGKLVL